VKREKQQQLRREGRDFLRQRVTRREGTAVDGGGKKEDRHQRLCRSIRFRSPNERPAQLAIEKLRRVASERRGGKKKKAVT